MKNPFTRRLRTLKIEGDDGVKKLYPGDSYVLTTTFNGSAPGMTGEAKISITYYWDGRTLTRKR